MSNLVYVEDLMDLWLSSHPVAVPFKADDVATVAGLDRRDVSDLFQQYRAAHMRAQERANRAAAKGRPAPRVRHPFRYVLAAEGYGRAARWKVQWRHGSDTKALQRHRARALSWSAGDAAARLVRDMRAEIQPSARASAAIDPVVQNLAMILENQIMAMFTLIEQQVAIAEATLI